ncbi:hypothetical protein [Xanthomonas arboricola]|uniref:hypothetical protein n=1 Tax=Xanthomonas arboricola TaxID=56448 RepID=UPI00118B9B4F|nr:hypothetical protein [Xanthomonas arboricola]QDS16152.1 hypothetical protein FPL04_11250 [Xanthomonas arboricola]
MNFDESVEDVERILWRDPSGVFCKMDARSQADYRWLVDRWSARSGLSPCAIANLALELAQRNCLLAGVADRRSHIGYYFTGKGLLALSAQAQLRLSWREQIRHEQPSWLLPAYTGLIAAIAVIYALALIGSFSFALSSAWTVVLGVAVAIYGFCLLPSWIVGLLYSQFEPYPLPRLDFSAGIGEDHKTLVVVPCLLSSTDVVRRLGETLEGLHIDNRGCGASFALLSDFVDAHSQLMDDDEILIQEAMGQIDRLNAHYGGGFVLLHRPRRWNPGEGCWMGWERKRGKLEELNALLVEPNAADAFQLIHGDTGKLSGVQFVVTLDEDDTQLAPGSIEKLASSLAHPLNRPELSEQRDAVVAGYGVLQPRPMLALPKGCAPNRLELLVNMLVDMAAGPPRVDRAPHNLDQDMFGEVSYIGKGIYDVHVFHRLLGGRIAENSILSHDLLEGAFVRSACVGDVILPVSLLTYHANSQRNHRWMRGDWQLLPWLFGVARAPRGERVAAPPFARWKIGQNAVRMLLPAAALVCLVLGWMTCATPVYWTLAVLATAWAPSLVEIVYVLLKRFRLGNLLSMCRWIGTWVLMKSAGLIFLIHEAQVLLDAIVRASFRMIVSKRKMLEWRASSSLTSQGSPGLLAYYRSMGLSPLLALAIASAVRVLNPNALPAAVPFVITWLFAPLIVWWLSQTPLSPGDPPQPA